jgi:NAD+ synthase
LCARGGVVVGKERLTALFMPEEGVTGQGSREDALSVARSLGIRHHVVPINGMMRGLEKLPWKQKRVAEANSKARLRMAILYNYANSKNFLVAGSSNRTELTLGYFTKYGDGAADFLPLGSLLKTEVREIAYELGVPEKIISKEPSAELWKGQTDEKEIGVDYVTADRIIKEYFDKKKSRAEVLKTGISAADFERVAGLAEKNIHKNRLPEVI